MASPITTHVLDTSLGRPAQGIEVRLYQGGESEPIAAGTTDGDGRVTDLLSGSIEAGMYRLRFETGEYFRTQGHETFYPYVEVSFDASASEHYHVPLLVSAFGFSTYRGS